jgi:tight adherence protein B
MTQLIWLAPVAVFLAVFALALLATRSLTGRNMARMRQRLATIKYSGDEAAAVSMIREKYLRHLSPLERRLEELPGMIRLARMVEKAGYGFPGYRLALLSVMLAAVGAALGWMLSAQLGAAVLGAAILGGAPFLQIAQVAAQRLRQFEEQLPDALDMMARALRAGNPLVDTFKFVADEMEGPIAKELGTTWSHLNYGVSLKVSFEDLIERMPSTSLRAMATAILVQRETGGNLAEILDKISAVLRARFRFQRRVRSLTAEGRISAWVLILIPFGLAAVMSITSPSYLALLYTEPIGRTMIVIALGLMAVGIVWIQRTVRIRI